MIFSLNQQDSAKCWQSWPYVSCHLFQKVQQGILVRSKFLE